MNTQAINTHGVVSPTHQPTNGSDRGNHAFYALAMALKAQLDTANGSMAAGGTRLQAFLKEGEDLRKEMNTTSTDAGVIADSSDASDVMAGKLAQNNSTMIELASDNQQLSQSEQNCSTGVTDASSEQRVDAGIMEMNAGVLIQESHNLNRAKR